MKYIIMCGGDYKKWEKPRQLSVINGERIIERTIRLLKENGINDIYISSNSNCFDYLWDIPKLKHNNDFVVESDSSSGYWINCFYQLDEPVCYLFGDVFYSNNAIKTIVHHKTNDIQFFASAPPFAPNYFKNWAEPFAFKVVNIKHFKEAIEKVKDYYKKSLFNRHPISWELWQVIKETPINEIDYNNYCIINDYTCDIDDIGDIQKIETEISKGEIK